MAAALAVVALSVLAVGCSRNPGGSSAPPTTRATTTTVAPEGTWSKPIPRRAGREPDRRLVPRASGVPGGLGRRPDLPAVPRQGHAPRAGRAGPRAPGRVLSVVRRRRLLRRRAEHEPGRSVQRVDVAAPCHHFGSPGHHRHRLHRPHLLHDDRRRRQRLRLRRPGVVGQPRGLGGRQPDLVRVPDLLGSRQRAGPRVSTGRTWTQPNNADAQGQLNAVSCTTTAFCVLVDSSGSVLTAWNGLGFAARSGVDRLRAPRSPAPTRPGSPPCRARPATFCRAVDSIGRVFAWNGTAGAAAP